MQRRETRRNGCNAGARLRFEAEPAKLK